MNKRLKVAIVHDWLTNMGGAEIVVQVLHEMFPDAPIYTSLFTPERLSTDLSIADVRPSLLQRLPKWLRRQQLLLPFMPIAFELFDLTEYDLVISSSSACAKGVVTGVDTVHLCYCHTPMRYAWDFTHEYFQRMWWLKKGIAQIIMHKIRQWDRISADRVDLFVANSSVVQQRIKKHYQRDSVIIYPPVVVERFAPSEQRDDFYLVVSRLVPYKRVELAIKACNLLGRKLVIIGDGEQYNELKNMAGPTIQFLKRQPDEVVSEYMGKARAFLFPGYEDFGITMVEAQAAGCPVIAFAKGGAQDIVVDCVNGMVFQEQSVEALSQAILSFESKHFDSYKIRQNAMNYCVEKFKNNILKAIQNITEDLT